jgi:hypothetical protein
MFRPASTHAHRQESAMNISNQIYRVDASAILIICTIVEPAIGDSGTMSPKLIYTPPATPTEPARSAKPQDPVPSLVPVQAQSAVTVEETVTAIKTIYEGQGNCEEGSTKDNLVSTSLTQFAFYSSANAVTFSWQIDIDNNVTNKTSHHAKIRSFNPADIGQWVLKQHLGGYYLQVSCSDNQDCFESEAGKGKGGFFSFCDVNKAQRVTRALEYLHGLMQPSKRMPF